MSRTAEYDTAKANWTEARARYESATSRRARRDAAEAVEFWGSKMAMLGVQKGWAA